MIPSKSKLFLLLVILNVNVKAFAEEKLQLICNNENTTDFDEVDKKDKKFLFIDVNFSKSAGTFRIPQDLILDNPEISFYNANLARGEYLAELSHDNVKPAIFTLTSDVTRNVSRKEKKQNEFVSLSVDIPQKIPDGAKSISIVLMINVERKNSKGMPKGEETVDSILFDCGVH